MSEQPNSKKLKLTAVGGWIAAFFAVINWFVNNCNVQNLP